MANLVPPQACQRVGSGFDRMAHLWMRLFRLSRPPRQYVILSLESQAVARGTLWLVREEPMPIKPPARTLVQAAFRRWSGIRAKKARTTGQECGSGPASQWIDQREVVVGVGIGKHCKINGLDQGSDKEQRQISRIGRPVHKRAGRKASPPITTVHQEAMYLSPASFRRRFQSVCR